MCPPLEASVLVPSQGNSTQGMTHSRSLKCNSRQIVQTKASDPDRVIPISAGVQSLVLQMGRPQVDLFATWFNHKLPKFVSPDQTTWAVDASSHPWVGLDVYTFPPVSLLNQVVTKVMDQGCQRMILIASGWPNMPWFWDLVSLSVQIPFMLPLQKDLVTQPFNGLCHRNLKNLNLNDWLLEPPSYKNKCSLTKWQQELRLFRDFQPEPYTNQSGQFLSNGGSQMRWISGHPL